MELVITPREDLKNLFNECLAEFIPATVTNTEPESQRLIYSIKDLAEYLGCSPVTAQRLKNSGKIRYRQFGRKVVFVPAEVLEDLGRKR